MTKPIPEGGERKRPVRSCLSCRSSKLRCLEGDGPENGEASKRCTRCEKVGRPCMWITTKRSGPAPSTPGQTEGDGDGPDLVESYSSPATASPTEDIFVGFTSSPQAEPWASASPLLPPTVPFATHLPAFNSPPIPHSPDRLDIPALAASYLSQLHPFVPLLPDIHADLVAYLSTTSPLLAVAIYSLLNAPNMSLQKPYSSLDTTLGDCQAAVLFIHAAYSRDGEDEAREILAWLAVSVAQAGWHLIDAPENSAAFEQEFRKGVRALWWECWALEIMLGTVTGARMTSFSEMAYQVHVSDSPDDNDSPQALRIRALSLLAAATKPPPDHNGEEAARANALNTLANNLTLITHQTYLASCATLSATSSDQPRIAAQCEAAFMATLISSAATIYLLSSSSHFSSYIAPYSPCGLDTSSTPPSSIVPLLRVASSHIITLVRTSLSSPSQSTHSPFFGCALLVAAQGALLSLQSDRSGWRSVEVIGDVELLEWLLALQAKRWAVAGKTLQQVKQLKFATFGAVGLIDRLLLS